MDFFEWLREHFIPLNEGGKEFLNGNETTIREIQDASSDGQEEKEV